MVKQPAPHPAAVSPTTPPDAPGRQAAAEEGGLALGATLPGSDPHAAASADEAVSVKAGALVPARVGRYVILRQLGQGGMGVVFSAYDADLDRKVALKLVRAGTQAASLGRARVLQEAQALARIAHPNVVHVYEVGEDPHSGEVFIAMEFVSGVALADWQQQHPARDTVSVDACLRLYLQAGEGLAAAHQAGLIHRDFKPDNVLLGEDGRVRVVDFGLARPVTHAVDSPTARGRVGPDVPGASGERLTLAGSILGTPGYMAPEQVRGDEADARSDQFSFCVSLYEALNARLPFAAGSFAEYADNLQSGRMQQPAPRGQTQVDRPSEIPWVVEQALQRGLSTDPGARFPSMAALCEALAQGLRPDAESQRARQTRRRTLLFLLAMISAVLLLRSLFMWLVPTPPEGLGRYLPLALLSVAGLGAVIFRKHIARHPESRQLVYFCLVALLAASIARVTANHAGIPVHHALRLEVVWLAALFALELPSVGRRYLWPILLCGLLFLLLSFYPAHGRFYLNPLIALIFVLGTYGQLAKSSATDSRPK